MNRLLIPALLSAILIAVLVAVNKGIRITAELFSTDAIWGFLAGCIFMMLLVLFIMWIDPASRPRGSGAAPNHQRPRNTID